ncbi:MULTISPECIES: hypothetical protein [unclassified Bradyrhizobium]|uniref:hypothetical protein n=1 Tax=unclassified Bradyrhizobium TaxID=2631580 RepID=UPI002479C768|nr:MULTISPECIES: hypothetical protein [unclassified Bradyrhizobium]WGS22154.1 hypothetical protein MTX22_10975 [Bradyrhizobium sp. ISRA463]WGS29116.1 hypothetical protein MTX19_08760 [Bradyrhizobium sp. ISRA464]
MQKIAASFERGGALSLALCCNISAFCEKFVDHQTGTIQAVDWPSLGKPHAPRGCASAD